MPVLALKQTHPRVGRKTACLKAEHREELYKATSAGEEQQLRGARAEEHAAELRRGRDDLRRHLVELGAQQHAAVLPQLEVNLGEVVPSLPNCRHGVHRVAGHQT